MRLRRRRALGGALLTGGGVLLYSLRRLLAYDRQSPSTRPSTLSLATAAATPSLTGLWQVGAIDLCRDETLEDIAARDAPAVFASAVGGVDLHVNSAGLPLRAVPRAPVFRALSRPAMLPRPPDGSLHLVRPAGGDRVACLSTRNPALGQTSYHREWTLEAVVLFLSNEHFAQQWQTVIGRNGFQMSHAVQDGNRTETELTSLALKLSPKKHLVLQAWLTPTPKAGAPPPPPRLVTIQSAHSAQSNTWYHMAIIVVRGLLQLHINGQLEAAAYFDGSLARPPRPSDGDLTFGCGMHVGVPADACSCLLSEVRASNRAVPSDEWLWSRGHDHVVMHNLTGG